MPLPETSVIVFDLDDTLYPEREFVRSGFHAAANFLDDSQSHELFEIMWHYYQQGVVDVFSRIIAERSVEIPKTELIECYRRHIPQLQLAPKVIALLDMLKVKGHPLGLITDGRSITQRNKIDALGLSKWGFEIAISEEIGAAKPASTSFLRMQAIFPDRPLVYLGDNPAKDFVAPNRLGWTTICLQASETNIHEQDFSSLAEEYLPQYLIESLA